MNRPPAWFPGIDPFERARRMRARYRRSKKPPGANPYQLDLFSDPQTTEGPPKRAEGQTK